MIVANILCVYSITVCGLFHTHGPPSPTPVEYNLVSGVSMYACYMLITLGGLTARSPRLTTGYSPEGHCARQA